MLAAPVFAIIISEYVSEHVVIVVAGRFYIALFSALGYTHCACM